MSDSDPINPARAESGDLPLEISVTEASRLMSGADGSGPMVLDVREMEERDFCRLTDHLHIPTGEIPARWKEVPADRHVLVYCHHGMRSLRVVQFLRARGLNSTQSLQGGIEAWSRDVDSAVPRY